VVLASASPRRAELIKKIPWLRAAVFPSNADEPPYTGGGVSDYACGLAKAKAENVFGKTGGIVIGADTVVCAGGEILGKPKDKSDAQRMFRLLCGNSHEVITGICVTNGVKTVTAYCKTLVTFGEYNEAVVCKYINSGAPMDKAGAYGLQDEAIASLIERVDGDADNVVGLPVGTLEKTLKEFL
jgi:septum formation protein